MLRRWWWCSPALKPFVIAGWGGRPGEAGAWGAVVGVGADAVTPTLDMTLRLEVRRQHGGFRQGSFGPDYELARFRVAGPDGVPLSEAPFPDGFSLYGEAVVGWDAVSYGGLQRHLMLSLGAEAFTWGRFDVDGRVAVQLFERSLEVALKALVSSPLRWACLLTPAFRRCTSPSTKSGNTPGRSRQVSCRWSTRSSSMKPCQLGLGRLAAATAAACRAGAITA